MGGMALWPQLLRSDVLRQLIYTAKPVDAAQGERWGLVTQIAEDPLAAATELATHIAEQGPNAVRMAKSLIDFAESGVARADVLLRESEDQLELIGKAEQMEIIAARMQNRKPVFK
jgi:enoyl-CoA hydratase/carnithine racemase